MDMGNGINKRKDQREKTGNTASTQKHAPIYAVLLLYIYVEYCNHQFIYYFIIYVHLASHECSLSIIIIMIMKNHKN